MFTKGIDLKAGAMVNIDTNEYLIAGVQRNYSSNTISIIAYDSNLRSHSFTLNAKETVYAF